MNKKNYKIPNKIALIVGCVLIIISLIFIIKTQNLKKELDTLTQYQQKLQQEINDIKN